MVSICITTFVCSIILQTVIAGIVYSQNVSNIEDELVRKTVQEYLELCPYAAVCSLPANKPFPTVPSDSSSASSSVPCCGYCSCIDGCGSSCCPDQPARYLTDEEMDAVKQDTTRCQRMQYKQIDEENSTLVNIALLTVFDCPAEYTGDEHFRRKCNQNYHDFNFIDDISDFVPVSNKSVIFNNKYCAICHGADLERITYWDVGIACLSGHDHTPFNSLIGLKEMIDANDKCDIFFKPVMERFILERRCTPLIDQCNVTGHWRQYDADVERACMSYKSEYRSKYKNVHCFECNKRPDDVISFECAPNSRAPSYNAGGSFLTLLDFRGLLKGNPKPIPVPSVTCPNGHVYDRIQGECRRLLCPDYMYVSEDECVSFVPSVSMYDVIFTVEPRDLIRNSRLLPGYMAALYNTLWDHVSNVINTPQRLFTLCELFGFMLIRKDFNEIVKEFNTGERYNLAYSDIEYFAFRLQVGGYNGKDVTDELHKFDTMFEDYSHVPGLLPYVIRNRDIPVELFDKGFAAYTDYKTTGVSPRDVVLSSVMLDVLVHTSLATSFNYSLGTSKLVAPMFPYVSHTCISKEKYQVQKFCPKIELFANDFTVNDSGIMITDVNLFLPNHEILFTQNKSVLVCFTTYKSSIDQYFRSWPNDTPELKPITILSVICISLSLISLFITLAVYSLFKQLRTLPGVNIMSLVSCLFIIQSLSLINGAVEIKIGGLCIAVGISIHFSFLMSVSWMFICTFHMAKVFVRLEKMDHTHTDSCGTFTRYFCFTISVSALFVIINIVVSVFRSGHTSIGYDNVDCYLDSPLMVLFTVAIPLGFVVIANTVMFICVIIKVVRVPSLGIQRRKERNNIIIFAKLSTITGISWFFGFLHQFTDVLALAYVSVILNAGQGVFIMAAFVINTRVLTMFKLRYSHTLTLSPSKTSETNLTAGTNHSEEGKIQTRL